jgi:hypothetical protein
VNRLPPNSAAKQPGDQADGLRRLFAGRVRHIAPLVANPHVAFSSVVLERVTTALAANGANTLLVDAADSSPATPDAAWFDLAACVERLDARTSYLAARGLPRTHVNTRGSAASLLTALGNVAPAANMVVLHGEASELARVFPHCEVRPIVITSDHVEAVKHAYAAMKILAQRCGLMSFDLLMVAPAGSRRARAIVKSLSSCAESFIGAMVQGVAQIDPAVDVTEAPGADLRQLLLHQQRQHPAEAQTRVPMRAASALSPSPSWFATVS